MTIAAHPGHRARLPQVQTEQVQPAPVLAARRLRTPKGDQAVPYSWWRPRLAVRLAAVLGMVAALGALLHAVAVVGREPFDALVAYGIGAVFGALVGLLLALLIGGLLGEVDRRRRRQSLRHALPLWVRHRRQT